MRRLFQAGLSSLMILLPLSLPALAEPTLRVESVELRGLERTSAEAFYRALGVKEQQELPIASLKVIRRRMLALGLYQSVRFAIQERPRGKCLVVSIIENPILTDVRFLGSDRVSPERLAPNFAGQLGQVADLRAIAAAEEKVAAIYHAAGLPLARVEHTLRPDGVLELSIDEGRFEQVRIDGLKQVDPALVRRELRYQPGEVFDAARFERDVARLKGLKLIKELTPRAESGTLVLDAQEGQLRELNVGAGYSTQAGIMGALGLADHDFLGLGHQAGLMVVADQRGHVMGDTAYVVPWIDAQRTAIGANAYRRLFNNWMGDFRDERVGARLLGTRPVLGPPLDTPWRAIVGLQAEQVWSFDNFYAGGAAKGRYLDGSPVTVSPTGVDLPISLGVGLARDTRLRPDDWRHGPTQGAYQSLLLEPGLINGGTPFLKGTAMAVQYWPFPSFPYGEKEPATLVFAGRLGMVASPLVPAYKRFYSADVYFDPPMTTVASLSGNSPFSALGSGQVSPFLIRGWTQFLDPTRNALIPSLPSVYFQGANALVGTLEYRFPIYNIVSGAFFIDGGGFWDGLPDFGAFHVGYGGGLRVLTPLGPIALDYAMSGALEPRFHFSIGSPF